MENVKKELNALYSVSVSIFAKGYKKIVLSGIFVTKNKKCSHEKIKTKCWNFIAPQIPFEEYGISPEEVRKTFKISRIKNDFIFNEE
ncbi:hypothetical protein PIOMA14_II_0782 [Prevotella intermedia]|uniref:Uncharacterized protein n=1 Tax=Prevotella intermedia TaxID=28131 RepID=A0A0S3UH19_PREIN|nr:hypothetical protein [Prevotella intermedia]BAU16654.1 hypothetical protein PIOMA14_I_0145 [Prevotella intermedia]BAU19286.1 hypothetical protein PIOMA14_II_0782 [Prevotella intermedia]